MWCNDLACSYGQLVGGPSAFGLYVHCPICETVFGVMVLHAAMVNLEGSICLWYICALSYVSNLCGVMVLQRSYARSAMRCAKCGVAVLKACILDWGVNLP